MSKAYMSSDESDTEENEEVTENRRHGQRRRVRHLQLESPRLSKIKIALDNCYVKKVCRPSQVSSMVVSRRDPAHKSDRQVPDRPHWVRAES